MTALAEPAIFLARWPDRRVCTDRGPEGSWNTLADHLRDYVDVHIKGFGQLKVHDIAL
jgi:hypothetical protein